MKALPLYLASTSSRRLLLLQSVGIEPVVHPPNVAENPGRGESPEALVLRLAEAKGRSVLARLAGGPPGVVLAADTAVVIDGAVLGKPHDREEARVMLTRLRGRVHEVLTGVFLGRTESGRWVCELDRSQVRFRRFDVETLRSYVASGEGDDKAGAYGLQGQGGALVENVLGSRSNVIGLPLERLPDWLARIGVDLGELAGTAGNGG